MLSYFHYKNLRQGLSSMGLAGLFEKIADLRYHILAVKVCLYKSSQSFSFWQYV